jgi:sigma-B regulation protein RsbU (phosphoserine phosphatase)
MNIATRLVLLVTLCSVIVVGTSLILDYRSLRPRILQKLETDSRNTIEAAETDLENLLENMQGSALFLGKILEQQDYSREELKRLAEELVRNNTYIYGAAIALDPGPARDQGGFAPYFHRAEGGLKPVDLAARGADYSTEAWYRGTADNGKPTWTEPYFDKLGAKVLMTTYAVPVYRTDPAGERYLYAVVTADVTLEELHNYLQRMQIGEHGRSMLLSRAGTVISDRDTDNVQAHYTSVVTATGNSENFRSLITKALAGTPSTTELPCNFVPGTCILQVRTLMPTGWPVAVFHSQSDILAPLRDFRFRALATGLASALIAALVIWWVGRRMTRPLTALAAASEKVSRGELDTPLPAPRGRDEVARLVQSFHTMTRDLQAYMADLEVATKSKGKMEGELAAAREIQMSMLPGNGNALEATEDYVLYATVRPARSVGGDLYFYNQRGKFLYFAVGDVSDKGVPAALFMANAISHLQHSIDTMQPASAVAILNTALTAGNHNCMFLTLFLGMLDLENGRLHFASAGHPAPELLRGGANVALEQETGPALGLVAGIAFPANSAQLQPGDRLVIYSDGIEEAFNLSGQMFTVERLRQQLELGGWLPAAQAGADVFQAVDEFTGTAPQSDDMTLMVLDTLPAGRLGFHQEQSFEAGDRLVTRVLSWLESCLLGFPLPAVQHGEFVLLTEEIISNVARHAGLPDGDPVKLALSAHDGALTIEVCDHGRRFNPLEEADRATLGAATADAEVGGLGVHLISKLSDEQHYEHTDGRNKLRITMYIPGHGASNPVTGESERKPGRKTNMELTTTVSLDPAQSLARVSLDGALNTDTAPAFEDRLEAVLAEGHQFTILDMKDLEYISSAGLRVIFKAAKRARADGRQLAAVNRKPHIDKVFEILKALPDVAVFANDHALEEYLRSLQDREATGK